ncbi:MAG TPA: PAS domain-containing protein [Burkholderiaceae bacterium]|nr:PAS domain-containing protein [Burkholderiaceae bacterium]
MTNPIDPAPADAPLPAALAHAWLAQSHELLALTDAAGRLRWCNPAFARATGLAAPADLAELAPPDWHAGAPRRALQGALAARRADGLALTLRAASGEALQVDARLAAFGAELLWTLRDTGDRHALEARARHLSELLDLAQEFGRLGVWEREIPSGKGHWDRHVFSFWGLAPSDGTPDYALAASRIHPDDRSSMYAESTQRAGRYAQRYRVIQPDGSVRRIHSQWEVKNSPEGRPERTLGIMVDDTETYELARSRDSAAAHLRLAAELAGIVIWRHDLATDTLHYNDHGFKVLGIPYRAGGLPLAEARSYTHPDDVAKLAAAAARALRTDGPVDVQTRHRWPDGSYRHMLVRRVVERNAAGVPQAFVGVTLDITDQVEGMRRAEQLAGRLEAAAEAANIGIWTTVVGSEQTEWNAQMHVLFDQVDAAQPPTFSDWIEKCVHPLDRARVDQTMRAYLREGSRSTELEFRSARRDGALRWIVIRARIDRTPGSAPRVFGIAMDVTDRHVAAAALHAASERAAVIARSAGIGTWETSSDGAPAVWDEQMWHLRGLAPRAQLPDRDARLAMVHPADRARVMDANADTVHTDGALAYEFRVVLPDGSHRWLASRSALLRDEQGRAVRRVGVNWDVTEAKNAEHARQQALLAERESQAKTQFLSRMSHELRTPLNAVLGFTQLLQFEMRQLPGARAHTERLDHIRAAGEHLLSLIDDALDLSSLQAGALELDLQAVPIEGAVAQAVSLTAERARARGVRVHCGPLEGAVRADPARLRQVLQTLLDNAIQHNRDGGEVFVDARADSAGVHLRLRDTGPGLPAEQLAHLFEPFHRVAGDGGSGEGAGIGLAIVKALVEGMGGRIEVSSVVGQGSTFELLLRAAEAPPAAVRAARPTPAPRSRSGQLLYIEDNQVNVLLVEELVHSLSGLRIASEATGTAGVARARALLPNLVLIDMQLPDFDGFEVLRRIRAQPETAQIPCIALSANAMPDDIARGLAAGFDDYWTKPIKFKPFLDALDRLFPVSAADH